MSYSYCKQYGKDKVIFATKEDHETPSTIELPPPEPQPGILLENGEINWSCPCLGGMPTGPCGVEFRNAFSCFQNSEADPKGSDCYEAFLTMQDCFTKYPTVYKPGGADVDKDNSLDIANIGAEGIDDNTSEVKNDTESTEKNIPPNTAAITN